MAAEIRILVNLVAVLLAFGAGYVAAYGHWPEAVFVMVASTTAALASDDIYE